MHGAGETLLHAASNQRKSIPQTPLFHPFDAFPPSLVLTLCPLQTSKLPRSTTANPSPRSPDLAGKFCASSPISAKFRPAMLDPAACHWFASHKATVLAVADVLRQAIIQTGLA
jgi:hypothetical protein